MLSGIIAVMRKIICFRLSFLRLRLLGGAGDHAKERLNPYRVNGVVATADPAGDSPSHSYAPITDLVIRGVRLQLKSNLVYSLALGRFCKPP